MTKDELKAARRMDWMQVRLNGGPPCFHLDVDGSFCGRAKRWPGHDELHKFRSLEDLVSGRGDKYEELRDLLAASALAFRSYQYGNASDELAEEMAEKIEARLKQ